MGAGEGVGKITPDNSRLVWALEFIISAKERFPKGSPYLGFERGAALSHFRGSSGGQGKAGLFRQRSNDSIFLRPTGGFHWGWGAALCIG